MDLDDEDLELLGGGGLTFWEEQLEVFRRGAVRSAIAHTNRMHADLRKDLSRYVDAKAKRTATRQRNKARRRALIQGAQ
jgi:hypothetical protein